MLLQLLTYVLLDFFPQVLALALGLAVLGWTLSYLKARFCDRQWLRPDCAEPTCVPRWRELGGVALGLVAGLVLQTTLVL